MAGIAPAVRIVDNPRGRKPNVMPRSSIQPWYVAVLALALVLLSHWLQNGTGLDFCDEGYLWYGAVQTSAGHVPIRDFRSYDPGRYYWVSATSHIFGQGILGLRKSTALFQMVGLLCGLLALTRVIRNHTGLALAGVGLTLWMFPHYKIFESSISMMAVFLAVRLLEHPSRGRFLAAGMFVGAAAFFGRNLGLYCFLAFVSLITFMRIRFRPEGLPGGVGIWLAGVILGYSPMLVMALGVPRFWGSFVESVVFLYTRGGLNSPLPVPWPWTLDCGTWSSGLAREASIAASFLLIPLFLGISLGILFFSRRWRVERHPLLPASTFVALFYCHHAFSRADLSHLAESMAPLLLGLVALTQFIEGRRAARIACAAALIAATLPAGLAGSMAFHRLRAPEGVFVRTRLAEDTIWVLSWQAEAIESMRRLVREHVSPGESLLIAPQEPALYCILKRECPVWDPMPAWPHTEGKQQQMMDRLERSKTQWVLISNARSGDHDHRRFQDMQVFLWTYLTREFAPVPWPGLKPDQILLHRKDPGKPGWTGSLPDDGSQRTAES